MLSVVAPFRPQPVFGLLSVSLFFSLCLVCSPTPFLCLSLSSSQALGETQTFVVWVSPCVSWTRSVTSTRTSRTTSTPRSPRRLCFFASRRRRSFSGGGRSWSVLGVLGLSLSLSLSFFWRSEGDGGEWQPATVLSHMFVVVPLTQRGKCRPFFLCSLRRPLFLGAVFLFLGSLFGINFRERSLFLVVEVGLVFFGGVLPKFLFYGLAFCSRNCSGNFFMSGLLLWVHFLGLSFAVDVVLFFFVFFQAIEIR